VKHLPAWIYFPHLLKHENPLPKNWNYFRTGREIYIKKNISILLTGALLYKRKINNETNEGNRIFTKGQSL
jgi:hypothetical protein